MVVSDDRIIEEFTQKLPQLGIHAGDALFVHSSLRSFGIEHISPKAVIDGLRKAVGDEGTVLFPAFSYSSVTAEHPVFDYTQTECCVGYLPEYFRTKYPGTIRSMHPTHSVSAVGKWAAWFVEGHELDDTPCGKHSPVHKLAQLGGKIVFLGCQHGSNTSMHAVEEYVNPPFLFGKLIPYTMRRADGTQFVQKVYRHNFAPSGKRQRYDRLKALLPASAVWEGEIFSAHVIVYDVKTMWSIALQQYLEDPFYFVEDKK